jgi:CheY-like chemotaxis protein
LCVNARDAMPNGGTLSIYGQNRVLRNERVPGSDAPVSGSFVELSVRDTGTGIPPEILQKIFDPFFTTKPEGKGTGLGLATVQTIIRNHNGFLDLSSEVGKGTTFKILLPAAPTDTKAPAEEPKADEYLGQGEFILIADDERALLEITKELLEAYNYNVMIASNGKEALHIFQQNRDKIAVVMTDLHMPGMGGAELIAKIAADSPQAITVCMSGSTEGEIPKSELPLCKAFLRKPSSTQEMLRALNTLLADRRKA